MNNRTTCVKEYPLTTPIKVGDKAEDGSQLRPYIVMFGEYVDSMNVAIDIVSMADIFVVIGTSLKVYPAAGFINYAHHEVPKFVCLLGVSLLCLVGIRCRSFRLWHDYGKFIKGNKTVLIRICFFKCEEA